MGAPSKPPSVMAAPPPPDTTKAMLDAYQYANTQRMIRKSAGRQGSFSTGSTFTPGGKNTLLGA
jgi:hypothetical protein